jgi:hypothetical protein
MRRGRRLLAIASILLCGCATHYYEIKGDTVSIYLKHDDARQVDFLTSLHHFRPRPSMRIDGDTWVNRVEAGTEFRYFYRIDGEVFLPECNYTENDDFGSENCIFVPGT